VESPKQRRTLSRTSSYLDALATALRDLGGPTTIPHELTQNADDAGNATTVMFNVDDEALTVSNDGTFSDCKDDGDTCLWARRCDLHAFRRFAGRNKAGDATTTGAFGVGFTSVYQITDRPELLYADQHWLIDESASENERIRACEGNCRRSHTAAGTTFVLPWAREYSELRAALSVPPVTGVTIAEIEDALLEAAKPMLIFLQHVSQIEVTTRTRHYRVEGTRTESGVVVKDDVDTTNWLFLTADFRPQAEALIAASHGLIDADRSSAVTVALPLGAGLTPGVLYATLPTQTPSGLPGRVNAAFYPSTDRKSVRFESDIYSDWNRAAIAAVASALAEGALDLVRQIGIPAFWEVLGEIDSLSRNAASYSPDHSQTYLDELFPVVAELPVIETTHGAVVTPAEAYLPMLSEAYESADALDSIGIPVVSKTLHRRLHSNSVYRLFGIRLLTSAHVVRHLMAAGFTKPFTPSTDTLTMAQVKQLLAVLGLLQGNISNVDGIRGVAIVPCGNGLIAPASKVVWPSSAEEAGLFELLVDDLFMADADTVTKFCPGLQHLWKPLDVRQAAALLERVDAENLSELGDDLLAWFDRHLLEIDLSKAAEIAALPIFPTSNKTFRPLTALSLPQDFDDPVNVASLVAFETARDYHRLLDRLGARPLDVVSYFVIHVLPAAKHQQLNITQAAQLLSLVGRYELELEPHRHEFAEAVLIPGLDGKLHTAGELHLPSDDIAVLAPKLPLADTAAVPSPVLEWLGVARIPTDVALEIAANRLAAGASDPGEKVATAILRVLQLRGTHATTSTEQGSVPAFLTSLPWLPLKRGGTSKPADVLPTNARHLYGMQGNELGISSPSQVSYFSQLTRLGMPSTPPVEIVVEHLKHCSDMGADLNPEVYRVLSTNADDRAVKLLRSTRCIHLGQGVFVSPYTTFWGRTPFGRWGAELPGTMRVHQKFFDAVGVREEPGPVEIAAVLKAIGAEFGTDLLGNDAEKAVHGCWSQLSELLDHSDAARVLSELGHTRSALDSRGVLANPEGLFFEDSRGTCRRFKLLANNVIPRSQATGPSLERAGVRRVEELISAELPGGTPQPDDELPRLISERIGAFRRLLNDDQSIKAMQQVNIFRVEDLAVKFRAELFGYTEVVGPEPTDAIYLRETEQLVYDQRSTSRALARELARAIHPDDDPGRLAIQLQPVIDAASASDAHSALDDYGIDRLDTEEHEATWSVAVQLNNEPGTFADNEVDEVIVGHAVSGADDAATKPQVVASEQTSPSPESSSNDAAPKSEPTNPSNRHTDFVHAPGHPTTEVPDRAGSGFHSHKSQDGWVSENGSSGAGPGARTGASRGQASRSRGGRQTRLRSYVLNSDNDDSGRGAFGDEAPDFTPIDTAGVARVLEYEKKCGREPVEMEHGNHGFDVESYDPRNNLVRRIEIKSTGGAWSVAGVMLSRRQHKQAREDGNLFWLYVVENALDDENAHIFRIQNPAERIDYFGFDDGWKTIAETDIERDPAGAPVFLSTRSIFGLS
jgi:hypothetical protein